MIAFAILAHNARCAPQDVITLPMVSETFKTAAAYAEITIGDSIPGRRRWRRV